MSSSAKRPNFLVIIADDLGYSDLGCFGGEIKTPNLDKLASQGIRMTNFHTASACSPTRSMLLSGTDNHIAGVGAMVEHMNDEYAQEMWAGQPGHEGYLVSRVAALPEVLRDAGYRTILTGKWHLGMTKETIPAARGFDRSYTLLAGGASHYAWEPQFEPGNPEDDHWASFQPSHYDARNKYAEDFQHFSMPANFPPKPDGYFSSVTFTTKLLSYLEERKSNPELKSKPFFAYHAFTAPHFPLQASKERIAKYRGMYDDGPRALRAKRLAGLKKLGMLEDGVEAHEMVNPWGQAEWAEMTEEERGKSARAMETYAAMVEQLDENVGRLVEQLEADGELDNTVVIFMSDNGAEGSSYEVYPSFGPSLMKTIEKHYNNDIDNIGEADSFVWYGNFWAQASTAPGWLYKMYTSQGGIRVPFILRYPGLTNPELAAGTHQSPFATVMDLMPTFLDLAGASHPSKDGKPAMFHGREVVPMRGKSWRSWMEGKEGDVHEGKGGKEVMMGWELHGRAAYRKGDWKIVYIPPPHGLGEWQLFHISEDPWEVHDVAQANPEVMKDVLKAWDEYVKDSQVVWPEAGGFGEVIDGDETADPKGWMKAKAPRKRPLL